MCDSGKDETKRRYVQLYLEGEPGYCVPLDKVEGIIHDELETMAIGESLELIMVEMTDEQYAKAPEFEGW